ncbi:nucleoporin [Culex quinquefasciatus]|uniref:Nucleoporin n=1 Tax=Culex quinquefasciatus TaxID=7176 RepID=B0WRX7_CULQU|nr:nucleoporin [Culex quinquefasciatus]|eukprot:XP_001851461.1 nucleoporin [Culex quinquefasciatus]
MAKRGAQSDLNHGNWNDEKEGFTGVTYTPALKPAEGGTSPFSLLIGIAKPTNGTRGASIFATTDPSKQVFSRCRASDDDKLGRGTDSTGFGFDSKSSTTGTGFRFHNVIKPTEDSKPDEKPTTDDDEDEPFKVEFTPVKEKDSIFSKPQRQLHRNAAHQNNGREGAGPGAGRHRHRPDFVNIILNETVPVQGMGKNNVMLVCVPTPKPPPTSVLLWVKTGEEADELYETLLKQKPN